MSQTATAPRLLTTKQFSEIVGYDERTLREQLTNPDSPKLKPGRHYSAGHGVRKKMLFNWTAIAADMGMAHDQHKPGDLVSTKVLGQAIQYSVRTIRETLQGGIFREGQHFYRLPYDGSRSFIFDLQRCIQALGVSTETVKFAQAQEDTQVQNAAPEQPPPAFSQTATDFFAQAAELHLQEISAHLRATSVETVRSVIHRDLRPYFYDRTVSEITLEDVTFALQGLSKRDGQDVVAIAFRVLHAIFDVGTRLWGVPSPIRHLTRPPRYEKVVRAVHLDEIRRIIALAPPHYRNYFITRFFTGISNEEAASLRGKAIQLDTSTLRIDELKIGGEWVQLDVPKARTIPIPWVVKEALIKQRASNSGFPNPEDLVFTDERGRQLNNTTLNATVFRPLLAAAGVRPMLLREISNTAPFLWLCAGHTLAEVAEWSGHAEDTEYVLHRFKQVSFLAPGFSNLDRMIVAATPPVDRHQLGMHQALPM